MLFKISGRTSQGASQDSGPRPSNGTEERPPANGTQLDGQTVMSTAKPPQFNPLSVTLVMPDVEDISSLLVMN